MNRAVVVRQCPLPLGMGTQDSQEGDIRPCASTVAASLSRWAEEPCHSGRDRIDEYDSDLPEPPRECDAFRQQSATALAAGVHGPAAAWPLRPADALPARRPAPRGAGGEGEGAALAARQEEVRRALQAPASDPALPIADALRALREQLNRQPLPASSREEEEALRTSSCSTLRGHAWKVLLGGCALWRHGGQGGEGRGTRQLSCAEYLQAVSDRARMHWLLRRRCAEWAVCTHARSLARARAHTHKQTRIHMQVERGPSTSHEKIVNDVFRTFASDPAFRARVCDAQVCVCPGVYLVLVRVCVHVAYRAQLIPVLDV